MAEWKNSLLESVGNTPLLRLGRLSPEGGATVYAKFEGVNSGGSIKSRTALAMIEAAEAAGLLGAGSVIVEASSGNQGVALAMIGAVKGYRVRIVMPENMSSERRRLMEAYGAEVVLTAAGESIAEAIGAAMALTERMAAEDPRVFLPRQFANPANPAVHEQTTAAEIIRQLGEPVTAFVAGFGTGGTITGVARALKKRDPETLVVAAEPDGAALLAGGSIGHHVQQGIGDGVMPPILDRTLIDRLLRVSDREACGTARLLARREGILCGVSSGTNVWAAIRTAAELGPGKNVVTILPDTGERYLSTDLF